MSSVGNRNLSLDNLSDHVWVIPFVCVFESTAFSVIKMVVQLVSWLPLTLKNCHSYKYGSFHCKYGYARYNWSWLLKIIYLLYILFYNIDIYIYMDNLDGLRRAWNCHTQYSVLSYKCKCGKFAFRNIRLCRFPNLFSAFYIWTAD